MKSIELSEAEHEALKALVDRRRKYPEADHFERVGNAVVMPGARHDVELRIDREVLRRLGHMGLISFDREARDAFGHGRHVFDVTARAADFV